MTPDSIVLIWVMKLRMKEADMKRFLSIAIALIIFCLGPTFAFADPGDEHRSNNEGSGGTHGQAIGEDEPGESGTHQERNHD